MLILAACFELVGVDVVDSVPRIDVLPREQCSQCFCMGLILIDIALEVDVEVSDLLVPKVVYVVDTTGLQVPKTTDVKSLCFFTLHM